MLTVLNPSNTLTFVSSTVAEPASSDPTAAWSSTNAYAAGDQVYVIGTEHRIYECTAAHQSVLANTAGTATMTIASPCVVTWGSAAQADGTAVVFSTNGALPTGLTVGTTYYVKNRSGTTCNLTATYGGTTLINTSGTQSGTHTCKAASTVPSQRLTGDDPLWLDLGPTNQRAMFDSLVSTCTSFETSVGSPVLEVVVAPGICNGVAVMDVTGVSKVKCEMFNGATLVFSQEKTVDNTFIDDYYAYGFEPYSVLTDLLFGTLPPYRNATVKLTFTPTVVGATIKCGAVLYGNMVNLGDVQYGAEAGIDDYSVDETNEFGVSTLVKRGYSRWANYKLKVKKKQFRRVFSTLTQLRATPAVFVAADDIDLSPFNAYGRPKTWRAIGDEYGYVTFNLEVKGLS